MGMVPEFLPDLVHAHDWQAGLAPAYLRFYGVPRPSVITIHNIAFQGAFPAAVFQALELPPQAAGLDGVEFYGGVGYLKAGIANASAITTVSPTYAEEIKTAAYGMGLEGLIAARSGALHGIVNGIDVDVWNPETDPLLPATYTARKLQARAAEPHRAGRPLRPAQRRQRRSSSSSAASPGRRASTSSPGSPPRTSSAPATASPSSAPASRGWRRPSARSPPSSPAASAPSSATTSRSPT